MGKKVRFVKDFQVFQIGWTAELAEPDADKLIKLGICEEVPLETRARRLPAQAELPYSFIFE